MNANKMKAAASKKDKDRPKSSGINLRFKKLLNNKITLLFT